MLNLHCREEDHHWFSHRRSAVAPLHQVDQECWSTVVTHYQDQHLSADWDVQNHLFGWSESDWCHLRRSCKCRWNTNATRPCHTLLANPAWGDWLSDVTSSPCNDRKENTWTRRVECSKLCCSKLWPESWWHRLLPCLHGSQRYFPFRHLRMWSYLLQGLFCPNSRAKLTNAMPNLSCSYQGLPCVVWGCSRLVRRWSWRLRQRRRSLFRGGEERGGGGGEGCWCLQHAPNASRSRPPQERAQLSQRAKRPPCWRSQAIV